MLLYVAYWHKAAKTPSRERPVAPSIATAPKLPSSAKAGGKDTRAQNAEARADI